MAADQPARNFLLLGQTDAGKSTIAGHLLYTVGYFADEHLELDTKKKSCYSELLDRTNGELSDNKSKTVYFDSFEFNHNGNPYVLIDTPGHQIYIRQLIEGLFSTPLSAVCLVISSIEKEFHESFERGTVKEDLLLARSTGCATLTILFNKTDINPASPEMIEIITAHAKKLRFKNINVFHVSGMTGANLTSFLESIPACPVRAEPKQTIKEKNITAVVSIHTRDIFSAGYRCNVHSVRGEFQMCVEAITDLRGKPIVFVRGSDPVRITLEHQFPIEYAAGDKLILRNSVETIGFGSVV